MGQIKNIKLHIVTDIKKKKNTKCLVYSSEVWATTSTAEIWNESSAHGVTWKIVSLRAILQDSRSSCTKNHVMQRRPSKKWTAQWFVGQRFVLSMRVHGVQVVAVEGCRTSSVTIA